jgi:hypothetical protein
VRLGDRCEQGVPPAVLNESVCPNAMWPGIDRPVSLPSPKAAGQRDVDLPPEEPHPKASSYRDFLLRALRGVRRVLQQDGVAVLVIGDVAGPGKAPLPLAAQIWQDLGKETGLQLLELIEDHLPVQNKVSRIWGETKGQATDRDCVLVLARDDGHPSTAPEVIDWDEPYKDGGPDAAHARLKEIRFIS